jgi:hypothetical protein
VCRADTGACSPCLEHDECPSGACRIATGECFADENRLWVDASADCAAATGTELAPFCTPEEAFAIVNAQSEGSAWAVFVAGSALPLLLSDDAALPDRPLALIGPSSGVLARLVGDPPYHLRVYGMSDHYIARVTLGVFPTDGTILECSGGGQLWIDDGTIASGTVNLHVGTCDVRLRRSRVTEAQQMGIFVDRTGTLTLTESEVSTNSTGLDTLGVTTLERSIVTGNYSGGIIAPSGTVTLSNSLMYGNEYFALSLGGAADTATLRYVVVLGFPGLLCDPNTPGGSYDVRNSIVGDVYEPDCASAEVHRSLVHPDDVELGEDNVAYDIGYEAEVFVDYDNGDMHVRRPPPNYLLGIAVRASSDPAIDFDGDPRPPVDAPDYPGIDAAP